MKNIDVLCIKKKTETEKHTLTIIRELFLYLVSLSHLFLHDTIPMHALFQIVNYFYIKKKKNSCKILLPFFFPHCVVLIISNIVCERKLFNI